MVALISKPSQCSAWCQIQCGFNVFHYVSNCFNMFSGFQWIFEVSCRSGTSFSMLSIRSVTAPQSWTKARSTQIHADPRRFTRTTALQESLKRDFLGLLQTASHSCSDIRKPSRMQCDRCNALARCCKPMVDSFKPCCHPYLASNDHCVSIWFCQLVLPQL